MAQRQNRIIPGGDEFVSDEVVVADFEQRLHDGGVVDLLVLVELAAARISSSVNVADVILVNAQAANDVAIHDANMVDVEEQLEVGAADLLDKIDAEVHVIAKVARVAFHRMGAVAGVQVLQNQRDAFLFSKWQHMLPDIET